MRYHSPPALLSRVSAVFFDIDGTLIDLAATPSGVTVPANLPGLLRRLAVLHGGALALISGRALADIDTMFGLGIAVAAEHGAILRNAAGQIIKSITEDTALIDLRIPLRAAVAICPGVLLEEKRFGLAIHWRSAPGFAASLTSLAKELTALHPGLLLQPAHQALEIRVRGTDKADALEIFLSAPPFAGRLPVFVGDDLTDESAIARATALGGRGLHVGRDFTGGPAAVRDWLEAGLADEESPNA